MADAGETNLSAVAQYNFNGKNNDELSFRKNDIIAVIQRLDGGWWEGSLNGKIGWFPSNFVRPISNDELSEARRPANGEMERQRAAYRKEIIEDHLKEEQRHIKLLEILNDRYMRCIADSQSVGADELLVLRSNITDILGLLRRLYARVADEFKLSTAQQMFGKIFLDGASEFYPPLKIYCENHCIAVELINVKRNELEGALNSSGLDIKFWVAGLSTVYRHVEKYATTLQEIERTTVETHADRGNLQRAYAVYRDLYNYCEFVRRQKEAQMEFLASSALAPFGSDWAEALGRCVHVAKVGVSATRSSIPAAIILDEAVIRCIAIFAKSILLFEPLIASGGGYALRNRLACADLQLARENAQCMLCFRKGAKNLLVIKALTNEDFRRLCDALAECDGVIFERQPLELEPAVDEAPRNGTTVENIYVNAPPTVVPPILTQSVGPGFDTADSGLIPGGGGFFRRNRDRRGGSMRVTKKNDLPTTTTLGNGLVVNHELEMIMPEGLFGETHQPAAGSPGRHRGTSAGRHGTVTTTVGSGGLASPYSGWCIRPLAAQRGDYLTAGAVKLRKGLSAEEQEDAGMLRIIEGYCSGGGGGGGQFAAPHHHLYHHGAGPSLSSAGKRASGTQPIGGPVRRAASYPDEVVASVVARPQLIVAENEKLFVEEMEGDQIVVKERSLVDTVYALKDQMALLQKELSQLSKNFEQEQRARRRFEDSLRRSSTQMTTPKPLDSHKFGATVTPSDD